LRELNELARNGKDLSRLLGDLLGYFRNLVVYTVSKGDLSLLEVSEAEAAALKAHAELTTTSAVTRIMEILSDAEGRMREAISKKIMLEVAMLRAAQARNSVNLDTVLDRLKALRQSDSGAAPVTEAPRAPVKPVAPPAPVAAPTAPAKPIAPAASLTLQDTPPWQAPVAPAPAAATPPPPVPAPQPTPAIAGDIGGIWTQLMQLLKQKNSFTRSLFNDAFPVSLDAKFLVIGFDSSMPDHLSMVDNSKNRQLLEGCLKELGHTQISVKFALSKAPAGWVPPVEAAPEPSPAKPVANTPVSPAAAVEPKKEKVVPVILNKDDFKNDPLIKKALEVFKGEIIEVRA
jgi:DNA polymerase-3 subunit gamma/tau